MKKLALSYLVVILLACKEQSKATLDSTTVLPEIQKETENVTTQPVKLNEPIKQVEWIDVKFKNFSYQLPDSFTFQSHLSNNNKRVYISETNSGITIDIGNLEQGNTQIRSLITDIGQFAKSVNENNKIDFKDFELIDYQYGKIGNNESVIINQISNDVSGIKNISMIVKSHFIVSNPYYCSITFTYPDSSIKSKKIINRITESFKFPEFKHSESHINKNVEIGEENEGIEDVEIEKITNRPSIYETKNWILNKFKSYGNPDYTYSINNWDLLVLTSNDQRTAIEYTIPLCSAKIYTNTSHTFSSQRITVSVKDSRIKIDRDWKGFPHYESSFDFDFRFSSEENLVERMNDALKNMEFYCTKNTRKKEAF